MRNLFRYENPPRPPSSLPGNFSNTPPRSPTTPSKSPATKQSLARDAIYLYLVLYSVRPCIGDGLWPAHSEPIVHNETEPDGY